MGIKGIRALLFDLDDTLIRFEDYWKSSLLETFRLHEMTSRVDPDLLFEVLWIYNLQFEQQYLKQAITISQFRNYRLMEAMRHLRIPMAESDADAFNELHKTVSRMHMKANPEISRLLLDLSNDYALGIVTNGSAGWQQDKIEALGIRPFFAGEAILISDEVGAEKPAARIYELALHALGIGPMETLFIGDSWQNDIEGPGKLGIRSIWINPSGAPIPQPRPSYLMATARSVEEIREFLIPGNLVNTYESNPYR